MKKLPALQSPSPPLPGLCNLPDTPQIAPGYIAGAHVKQQQQIIVGGLYQWSLGDVPDMRP